MISLWLGAWANHALGIIGISLVIAAIAGLLLFSAEESPTEPNLDAESARMDLIVAVRPLRHNRPLRAVRRR